MTIFQSAFITNSPESLYIVIIIHAISDVFFLNFSFVSYVMCNCKWSCFHESVLILERRWVPNAS